MKEFRALRAKAYSHLMDDDKEKKKAKWMKKCVIKRRLMFENYKDSLFNNKTILKSQQRFKSNHRDVYTKEVNKIALRSNGHKRLQEFDRVTISPYWTNAFKVCGSEMLIKYNWSILMTMLINTKLNIIKVGHIIFSRSSIQNINNRRLSICKNKTHY